MAFLKIDESSVGTYAVGTSANPVRIPSDIGSAAGIGVFMTNSGNSSYAPSQYQIADIGGGHYGIVFDSEDWPNAKAAITTSMLYSHTDTNHYYFLSLEFDIRVIPDSVYHTTATGNAFVVGGEDGANGFRVYWSTTDSHRTWTFHQRFTLEPETWYHIKLVRCTHNSSQTWDIYCDGELKAENVTQSFSSGMPTFVSCSLCSNNSMTYGTAGTKIDIANISLSLIPENVEQRPLISATAGKFSSGELPVTAVVDTDARTTSAYARWYDDEGMIDASESISLSEDGTYHIIATDSNGYVNAKEVLIDWDYVKTIPFPCLPLQASYSVSSEPSIVRTAMYDGRSRQRIIGGGRKCKTLKCQFLMSEEQLSSWLEKWRTELHEGADWFPLQVLGDDDFIETKTVRLKKGEWTAKLKFRSATDTMYDVSMNFEVK